jgi:DNA polymerase-3 subunit delta'
VNSDATEGDRLAGAPHPRERYELYGHDGAETALLEAWRSGRMPHAILIGGPEGIGKATLAYRLARFVLAGSREARSLAVSEDHAVARQVQALAHPDLLVLRRVRAEDDKTMPRNIRVEAVRRLTGFFGSTAAHGGWRVCIIDTADELAREGANAVLKLLEEPPPFSLFLLVSHAPGRLLPTIRSRCRRLDLHPLDVPAMQRALHSLNPAGASASDLDQAIEAGGGSVRRALAMLLGGEGLEIHRDTRALLDRLPVVEPASLATLSERLRGGELAVFAGTVEDWIAERATADVAGPRLARLLDAWENVRRSTAAAETFNLDRKPLVFQVFSTLAEATRR